MRWMASELGLGGRCRPRRHGPSSSGGSAPGADIGACAVSGRSPTGYESPHAGRVEVAASDPLQTLLQGTAGGGVGQVAAPFRRKLLAFNFT